MADEDLRVDPDGARAMTGWLESFGSYLKGFTDSLIQGFAPAPGSAEPSGAMLAEVLESHHEAMREEAKGLHGEIQTTTAKVLDGVNVILEKDWDGGRGIARTVEG
ncbi:MAG: hypothetical protein ACRC20_09590 [Segniliparus sp.]|uniref:hypothetical protein n=1 Tax=Segniliparus sp. TaxID=2804064 RepID=UPI003F2F05CF